MPRIVLGSQCVYSLARIFVGDLFYWTKCMVGIDKSKLAGIMGLLDRSRHS